MQRGKTQGKGTLSCRLSSTICRTNAASPPGVTISSGTPQSWYVNSNLQCFQRMHTQAGSTLSCRLSSTICCTNAASPPGVTISSGDPSKLVLCSSAQL